MTWDGHKTAAECAVKSYGRPDRLRSAGYRFSLQARFAMSAAYRQNGEAKINAGHSLHYAYPRRDVD
jgi:hypothetical protein